MRPKPPNHTAAAKTAAATAIKTRARTSAGPVQRRGRSTSYSLGMSACDVSVARKLFAIPARSALRWVPMAMPRGCALVHVAQRRRRRGGVAAARAARAVGARARIRRSHVGFRAKGERHTALHCIAPVCTPRCVRACARAWPGVGVRAVGRSVSVSPGKGATHRRAEGTQRGTQRVRTAEGRASSTVSGLLRSSGRMGDSALLSHTLWRFTCRCGSVRSVGAGLFDLLACLFACLLACLLV